MQQMSFFNIENVQKYRNCPALNLFDGHGGNRKPYAYLGILARHASVAFDGVWQSVQMCANTPQVYATFVIRTHLRNTVSLGKS